MGLCELDFSDLGQGPVEGSCEHGNGEIWKNFRLREQLAASKEGFRSKELVSVMY
jgi:hypothetical protein